MSIFNNCSQSDETTTDVNSYRNSRSSLFAHKLVLGFPLLNGELSFGGEYSSVDRRTHYQVKPKVADNQNEKVKEAISSVFIDYNHAFGPLTLQIGMRYEYNDFNYYDNDLYVAEQSKTYG